MNTPLPSDALPVDNERDMQQSYSSNALALLLQQKRDEILKIAVKHGAFNIRVFGSAARGDDTPDSDIDFLVEAGAETSSWFPAGLILDLENILNRPVDVVTDQGLNPHLRDEVLREAIPL